MPWMTMMSTACDAESDDEASNLDSDVEADGDADVAAAPAMPLIMSSTVKKSTCHEARLQEVEKWFLDPVSSQKILVVVEPRDPNLKVDPSKSKFFATRSTRVEDLEAELALRLGVPFPSFELCGDVAAAATAAPQAAATSTTMTATTRTAGGTGTETATGAAAAAAAAPAATAGPSTPPPVTTETTTPFRLFVQEPIPEEWDHSEASDLREEHSVVRTPNKRDTINDLANRFLHSDGWLYLAFEVNVPLESFTFSSPKLVRGIESPLIEVSAYEKHCTQVSRMRDKGYVPVILLPRGKLPYMPDNRLALRGKMQLWELRHRLKENLTSEATRMESSEVLYLLVKDNKAVKMMDELEDLWEKYKDGTDGWLYIYYAAEATLG